MTEAVIVAIITGVLAFLGNLIATWSANRKSSALIAYRLQELEKKQDKHNSVIERTYKLEEKAELQEEKINEVKRRLESVEKREESNGKRN